MPRGTPDGSLQPYGYASVVTDPGLIYQMLWGFSPLDGQGRVIYLDTFNNGLSGLGANVTGAGVLASVTSETGLVFSPPNALKLDPGNVLAGDISQIYRTFFYGQTTRVGMEFGFVLSNTVPDIFMRLDYATTNGQKFIAVMRYNHAAAAWQIQKSDLAYVDIFPLVAPNPANGYMMQVKLVADWSTGRYVKALIGDNLIDLSAYAMPPSAIVNPGMGIPTFRAISRGAGTVPLYVGYILLTKDEP